jgi:hypothetical protein
MTRPDRDYDDILSRALHSTLDPIEPAGDGLAKIQRRIAEPWLKRRASLLRTELTALGWLIAVRCEPFFSAAKSGLTGIARPGLRRQRRITEGLSGVAATQAPAGPGRHGGSGRGRQRGWIEPTVAWLRPTLAVAGAVVIVVAGVFALGQFKTVFSPASDTSTGGNGHSQHGSGSGGGGGGGGLQSAGATPGRHPGSSPTAKAGNRGEPTTSPTCAPSPSPTTPIPTPSQSTPSASPSPTTGATTPPTSPSPSISPSEPAGGPVSGSPGSANDDAAVVHLPSYALFSSCASAGKQPA